MQVIFFYGAAAHNESRAPHRLGFWIIHVEGRAPQNDWSARRRGRYLRNTQHTRVTKNHVLSGIRTGDPCNQAAADLRLRPKSHRDQQCSYLLHIKKGKAVPLQAWSGPEGCRKLRFPDFMTTAEPYASVAFTARKYTWYSFLLEVESTPGPLCDRKDYVTEKFQWHHRESNPRPAGL